MAWKLSVKSEGFKAPYLQAGATDIKLTKAKLAWAALTVGRPDKRAVKQHGKWSAYEALFRWNMVLANIDFTHTDGRLRYSPAFNALDATEKGGVCFFLGMMFAKLVAQDRLSIPWLHHFDNFKVTSGKPLALVGHSKPDFVGLRPANQSWHIVEAKGSARGFSTATITKAKGQAKQVSMIDSATPACSIGTLLFASRTKGLQFEWHDPDVDGEGIALEDTIDVWEDYYRLPLALADLPEVDRAAFQRLTGVKISVDPQIASLVRGLRDNDSDGDWRNMRTAIVEWGREREDQSKLQPAGLPDRVFFAADGIRIEYDDDSLDTLPTQPIK